MLFNLINKVQELYIDDYHQCENVFYYNVILANTITYESYMVKFLIDVEDPEPILKSKLYSKTNEDMVKVRGYFKNYPKEQTYICVNTDSDGRIFKPSKYKDKPCYFLDDLHLEGGNDTSKKFMILQKNIFLQLRFMIHAAHQPLVFDPEPYPYTIKKIVRIEKVQPDAMMGEECKDGLYEYTTHYTVSNGPTEYKFNYKKKKSKTAMIDPLLPHMYHRFFDKDDTYNSEYNRNFLYCPEENCILIYRNCTVYEIPLELFRK